MKMNKFLSAMAIILALLSSTNAQAQAANYEIAPQEYVDLSEKALSQVITFDFDAWAGMLADDVEFDLINDSSADLSELYVSPVGTDSWGEDILGTDVLAVGENGVVTITDGSEVCDYDMRFVMADGGELVREADICELSSFTLTD